jgi:DNA-binding LacI/PurR family transcriptional regulator
MVEKHTIRSADVARLAGVSRSAVSRAYTPGAYVSPATRAKVVAAAELLNYRPNAIARSLSKKSSQLIGIVASSLDNPFYAQMLSTLSTMLQARGFGILLLIAETANIDDLIPQLLSYQVDGVILPAATLGSKIAIELERSRKPVVLVNRYLRHDVVSSVSGDNVGGGAAAADLLVRTGHKRVAYLAGLDDTSSSRDRGRGLKEQLARHAIAVYAEQSGHYEREPGAEAVRRLLSLDPRPDAIFCANDTMALAALEVAKGEYGLCVPQDISIIGYDNSEPAHWSFYDLTSVDQNLPEMARVAIELLMDKLAGRLVGVEHRVVPARLIQRSTTRALVLQQG